MQIGCNVLCIPYAGVYTTECWPKSPVGRLNIADWAESESAGRILRKSETGTELLGKRATHEHKSREALLRRWRDERGHTTQPCSGAKAKGTWGRTSIINDVAQWEPIENLREQCKAFLVQFVLDFAFKTVHFVQIPALVVSSVRWWQRMRA